MTLKPRRRSWKIGILILTLLLCLCLWPFREAITKSLHGNDILTLVVLLVILGDILLWDMR